MYKIYHIKGVKVGCTERWPKRILEQGYTLDQAEILAETDSINHAAKMEQRYQEEYGYPVDTHSYTHIRRVAELNKTPEARKKRSIALKGREITWKDKIGEANRGRKHSAESKKLSTPNCLMLSANFA